MKKKRYCFGYYGYECKTLISDKRYKDYSKGLRCPICRQEYRRRYIYGKKKEYKKMGTYGTKKELGGRGDSDYFNFIKKRLRVNIHQIHSRLMIYDDYDKNYYYDIGEREIYDPLNKLKKIVKKKENDFVQYGEEHPRFLEDFVEYHRVKKIKILTPLRLEKKIIVDTKEYIDFLKKHKTLRLNLSKAKNKSSRIKVKN